MKNYPLLNALLGALFCTTITHSAASSEVQSVKEKVYNFVKEDCHLLKLAPLFELSTAFYEELAADGFLESCINHHDFIEAAAAHGTVEILEICAKAKVPFNQSTDAGVRPIHAAAKAGNLEAVKWLIEHGADKNAAYYKENSDDNSIEKITPLLLAILFKKWHTAEWLLENDASLKTWSLDHSSPLHNVDTNDGHHVVELLIARGADVNEKDSLGNTPLKYAITGRHEAIAKILLNNGAEVSKDMHYFITNPKLSKELVDLLKKHMPEQNSEENQSPKEEL